MGWTFEEYENQPLAFLQTVRLLRNLEIEEQKRQEKYGSR